MCGISRRELVSRLMTGVQEECTDLDPTAEWIMVHRTTYIRSMAKWSSPTWTIKRGPYTVNVRTASLVSLVSHGANCVLIAADSH
jgi:hypothetical protein